METSIDWNNLSFRLTPAKTMYVARTGATEEWSKGEFVPFGPISISPAAGVLNYGQGIIEGLKAFRNFRWRRGVVPSRGKCHPVRARGATAMHSTHPIPHFVEVMIEIVRQNIEYVPPVGLGSLYLRPCLWGTGEILGVAPAPEYCFSVYVSPVGNYFRSGAAPVKFIVCETFHRSATRGIGGVKFIGNYAPTVLHSQQAKESGFAGTIFLDARHEKYVEEAGVANFFCVKGDKLLTPQLGESILSGVTRSSVMQLACEVLNMEVIEMQLPIETVLQADECFCSGTAAVITPIGSITYKGRETVFNHFNFGPRTRQIHDLLVKIQQGLIEDSFGWLVKVS